MMACTPLRAEKINASLVTTGFSFITGTKKLRLKISKGGMFANMIN